MSIATVAELKLYAKVTTDAHDTLLQTILDGAQSFMAAYLNVTFGQATQTAEIHDGGFKQLWLDVLPVASVSVVNDTYTSVDVDITLVENDDRAVLVIYGGLWGDGDRRYGVTYVGGYVAGEEPEAVKLAVLQLAARAYDNNTGKSSQAAAGYGTNWEKFMDADMVRLVGPHSYQRILS